MFLSSFVDWSSEVLPSTEVSQPCRPTPEANTDKTTSADTQTTPMLDCGSPKQTRQHSSRPVLESVCRGRVGHRIPFVQRATSSRAYPRLSGEVSPAVPDSRQWFCHPRTGVGVRNLRVDPLALRTRVIRGVNAQESDGPLLSSISEATCSGVASVSAEVFVSGGQTNPARLVCRHPRRHCRIPGRNGTADISRPKRFVHQFSPGGSARSIYLVRSGNSNAGYCGW